MPNIRKIGANAKTYSDNQNGRGHRIFHWPYKNSHDSFVTMHGNHHIRPQSSFAILECVVLASNWQSLLSFSLWKRPPALTLTNPYWLPYWLVESFAFARPIQIQMKTNQASGFRILYMNVNVNHCVRNAPLSRGIVFRFSSNLLTFLLVHDFCFSFSCFLSLTPFVSIVFAYSRPPIECSRIGRIHTNIGCGCECVGVCACAKCSLDKDIQFHSVLFTGGAGAAAVLLPRSTCLTSTTWDIRF